MGLIDIQGYAPKHLSYSTINSYRGCGKRLYFEKVLKLEQIPGLAAIGGNAVHVASQVWDLLAWEHGIENMDDIDLSAVDMIRMIENA